MVDVKVIQRGHLDEGLEEVLGESAHLLDPLSASNPAVLVLVLELTEAEVRATYDALAGLQETLACICDSLRERSDITSSLVALREREKRKAQNCMQRQKVDDSSTHCLLGHEGRWRRCLVDRGNWNWGKCRTYPWCKES